PFWYGSHPLVAPVRGQNGVVSAHPLDRELVTRRWLFLFAEPTTVSGDSAIRCLGEYNSRYSSLEVGVVLALSGPYAFLREREIMENVLKSMEVECVTVTDTDRLLAEAFHVKRFPKILLLDRGQIALEQDGFEE